MNITFFYVLIGLIFFALVGAIITCLILYFKEEKTPEDNTIFEHFIPQYSDGFTEGVIDKISYGAERTGIYFFPRDINYVKLWKIKKEKVKIKPQLVFFKNNLLISLPKDTLSGHRNKMKGFPPTPEDLPENFKRNLLGRAIMTQISNLNKIKHEIDIVREEAEMIKLIDRREYSEDRLLEHLEEHDEDRKDLKKSLLRDEKKTFPSLDKK